MTLKRVRAQRCCANTSGGDRCSRWCAPGETVCAIHKPTAVPVGVIAGQDTDDLGALLMRLTKDRDPAIRLRAIEARLKWEERAARACSACAARAENDRTSTATFEAMTDEERCHMANLVRQFRAIKERVYVRCPDLRPAWFPRVEVTEVNPVLTTIESKE